LTFLHLYGILFHEKNALFVLFISLSSVFLQDLISANRNLSIIRLCDFYHDLSNKKTKKPNKKAKFGTRL